MDKWKKEGTRQKEIKYGAATRKMRGGTLANGILWVEKPRYSAANEQQVREEYSLYCKLHARAALTHFTPMKFKVSCSFFLQK